MKVFEFEGFGNYSTNFGWDNGVEVSIIDKMPTTLEKGIIHTTNSHGGSRNIYGMVTAKNRYRANRMIKAWAKRIYPKVEYKD